MLWFPFHRIQLKIQNLEHNQSRGYLCIKDAKKVERVIIVISFPNEPLVKPKLLLQCMARMTMIPKRNVSEDEENWLPIVFLPWNWRHPSVHECPHGAIKKTSFPSVRNIASAEKISFFSLSQLTLTLLIHFDGEPIFSSSLTLGAFTPSLIHSLIHPTFCSEAHIQQESPIILCRYSSLFVQKLLKQCEQCERWKQ